MANENYKNTKMQFLLKILMFKKIILMRHNNLMNVRSKIRNRIFVMNRIITYVVVNY